MYKNFKISKYKKYLLNTFEFKFTKRILPLHSIKYDQSHIYNYIISSHYSYN